MGKQIVMLFTGSLESIVWDIHATYLSKGYQKNTLTFSVTGCTTTNLIIPVPWASNKPTGGINITKCSIDYKILDLIRKLRENNLPVMFIEDVKTAYTGYNDDFGYILLENLESNKDYTIEYSHKICASSELFIPLLVSYNLVSKNISKKVSIKANGFDPLRPLSSKIARFIGNYAYEYLGDEKNNADLYISVNDWDSSDDEPAQTSSNDI